MREAVIVTVRGRVQGVGFRPFVYRLSKQLHLAGTVQNNMDGVRIVWEGKAAAIHEGVRRLRSDKPRLSRVDALSAVPRKTSGLTDFRIVASDRGGKSTLVIPVDSAVCDDCLREMRDPTNFRYRYPFINCTQCGPRYTIIEALPYDRPYTSMKDFAMCRRCAAEYRDPFNRRYHAQPIACDACGPHLSFLDMDGAVRGMREEALADAVRLLASGGIVAVKGIGGFHLACDAANAASVAALRKRKGRPAKPLAVMVRDVRTARQFVFVSTEEEKVLRSPEAPIVLLRKKADCSRYLAETVAPGIRTVGVMLPYTPLHHLLFDDGPYDCLVMTSANPSGLPILSEDDHALSYLRGIADSILTHNRRILHAIDDSVVRINDAAPFFLRRARGYVPDPIATQAPVDGIVALGSQMKNTFAIGRGNQIFVGPHLGDLSAEESRAHYRRTLAHLMTWTGIRLRAVAVDAHPLYSTRAIADELGTRQMKVQHHHAHLVSCMADNNITAPCYGLILDGTGYGSDGKTWGFELLYGNASGFRRLAHLRYTPLPGSDRAVLEPWRNAAAMLITLLGDRGFSLAGRLFSDHRSALPIIAKMINRGVNCPQAGTCGRLFDAVSAILGLCEVSTYDGEAAIRLSECCEPNVAAEPYPFMITGDALKEIDMTPALAAIAADRLNGRPVSKISTRFHATVVEACCSLVRRSAARYPEFGRRVMLSGGSFNNIHLAKQIFQKLTDEGFHVYTHHRLPCGDGGLSFGQLTVAAQKLAVTPIAGRL